MICRKCGYEWESRVENPKACPRCKYRLDYIVSVESKNEVHQG